MRRIFILCFLIVGMCVMWAVVVSADQKFDLMQQQHSQIIAEQARISTQVSDLSRRMEVVDSEHMAERLASIETTVNYDNHIVIAMFLGMVLLVLERIVIYARPRNKAKREG